MSFRTFLLVAVTTLCGALSPVWSQTVTASNGPFTRNYVFPPVGLGSTETASVTVVNTATSSTTTISTLSTPTPTSGSAPSCTGTISFSNANGAIGTPTSFTVGSEEYKTVTLPFAEAGLSGIRGEFQAKVTVTASTQPAAPCSLSFTLETYDSTTGATHLVLNSSLALAISFAIPANRQVRQ